MGWTSILSQAKAEKNGRGEFFFHADLLAFVRGVLSGSKI